MVSCCMAEYSSCIHFNERKTEDCVFIYILKKIPCGIFRDFNDVLISSTQSKNPVLRKHIFCMKSRLIQVPVTEVAIRANPGVWLEALFEIVLIKCGDEYVFGDSSPCTSEEEQESLVHEAAVAVEE